MATDASVVVEGKSFSKKISFHLLTQFSPTQGSGDRASAATSPVLFSPMAPLRHPTTPNTTPPVSTDNQARDASCHDLEP